MVFLACTEAAKGWEVEAIAELEEGVAAPNAQIVVNLLIAFRILIEKNLHTLHIFEVSYHKGISSALVQGPDNQGFEHIGEYIEAVRGHRHLRPEGNVPIPIHSRHCRQQTEKQEASPVAIPSEEGSGNVTHVLTRH